MTDHPNLASALVAALADLTVVEKDQTANAGSYSYAYADLGAIIRKTRPVLAAHGVVVLQELGEHGNGLGVLTHLIHPTDMISFGPFPFPHGKDAQATGSMVTYHRRYALLAALGMATGEDDDGAAAAPREAPTPGYRSSLVAAIQRLSEGERASLREWVAEQGLPDSPSKMNEEQADMVCDYILNGLPAAS
jgi:hypothetical protein